VNAVAPSPAISPPPSLLEAAAIAVAIERFTRDSAPLRPRRAPSAGGWLRAARLEAVARAPGLGAGGADRHPWRDRPHAR
jgi:hypothetical protein